MKLTSFAPNELLRPFLRSIEIIETENEMIRSLLPDTTVALAMSFRGERHLLEEGVWLALPTRAITGLRASARHMHTSADGGVIVAKPRAGFAPQFFTCPVHELFGKTLPLETHFSEALVTATSQTIREAKSNAERVEAFQEFLVSSLRPSPPPVDSIVLDAIAAIERSAGAIRVATLAENSRVGLDALEKRFRKTVGATPKQYASIVRLRTAVAAYGETRSLTELSLQAGYCDQSHFIRDFRKASGNAPRHFLEETEYC